MQVESLGGGTATAVFVSVFSIANCLGRLCSGFLPDRLSERGMPRTVSLIFLSALTFVACLLNAFARLDFFGAPSQKQDLCEVQVDKWIGAFRCDTCYCHQSFEV